MFVLDGDLGHEEVDLLLVIGADGGQLLPKIFGQLVDGVLEVLALGDDDGVVHIDLLLGLGDQDTGSMAPRTIDQGAGDGLHGGDAQVLDIASHDAVDGDLGNAGFIGNGLVLPLEEVPAEAAPLAPPLHGHGQEIGAIAGLTDAAAAYADVMGLLFQCFW